MIVIVTGVASLIHIYSWGYMGDDPGFSRFFACLSLFTFSMLGIVLSNNFLQLFIFWELVGACSYLLIGFWFERPAAADAGKKAFITNRLGDFGFFIGILWVWAAAKSLKFGAVQHAIESDTALRGSATIDGSVIYVMHHEQDIWRMGDLRRKMPVTFWTFMAGTLALAGVPPLSGFYSKDGILAQALHTNLALFVVGTAVAILTTFYMFRLIF